MKISDLEVLLRAAKFDHGDLPVYCVDVPVSHLTVHRKPMGVKNYHGLQITTESVVLCIMGRIGQKYEKPKES